MDNNTIPQVGAQISINLNNYQIIPTDHQNLDDISVNKTKYFINTNKTITVKTLEAMCAENVVICLKNMDTENFIKHKETGILIDNLEELPKVIQTLEESNDLRIKISQQARDKIIKEHSLDKFLTQWSLAFNMIWSVFYSPIV